MSAEIHAFKLKDDYITAQNERQQVECKCKQIVIELKYAGLIMMQNIFFRISFLIIYEMYSTIYAAICTQ